MLSVETIAVADDVRERLLQGDIALLNAHNVSDPVLSLMAAEHAARCETLGKMMDPTLGRTILLMIAGRLLEAAKQIEKASYMTTELSYA